ncbi:hypothetical protein ZWY2020_029022 [Hordeum vulgare]|nr:hypothetical protein ZWY2020_029022 [Hordeum vulgare]
MKPKYPLWKHDTKLAADPSGRGGNTCFRCHFCMLDFPGSYTRIRAHLLKILNADINPCTKITQPLFEELRNEDKAASILISHGKTRNTLPLPPFEESGPSVSSRKRKVAGKESGISESFHSELRQQADALIARMFITGGMQLCITMSIIVVFLKHSC